MYLPTGLRGKTLSPSRIIAGNQEGGGHEVLGMRPEVRPKLGGPVQGVQHAHHEHAKAERSRLEQSVMATT